MSTTGWAPVTPQPRRTLGEGVRYHGQRWLPVAVMALLTLELYPVSSGIDLTVPSEGEVARDEVLAPFAFTVYKSSAELNREREQFAGRARPIYDYRSGVVDSILVSLDRFFDSLRTAQRPSEILETALAYGISFSGEEAQYLQPEAVQRTFRQAVTRMLTTYLDHGVLAPRVTDVELPDFVVIRQNGAERTVGRDDVLTFARYLDIDEFHPDRNSSTGHQVFLKILTRFFAPTLVLNEQSTEAAREALRAGVDSVKFQVRADERIVAAHDVITADVRDKLMALQRERLARGISGGTSLLAVLGQLLTDGLVLSVFWLLIMLYLPRIYDNVRHVNVLAGLFTVVIIGAWLDFRFLNRGVEIIPELIPIPFAAIIITVLFNGRIAIVAAMVLAVLLASQSVFGGTDAFLISLLGGVTAALGVRHVRRRSHILISAGIVALAFALAALTASLRAGWPLSDLGASVLRGAANAVVSASLAFLLLPIFETLTHITTDLSLLELSDPARPLLRRLATEVPGTYAHSVAVANLCEAGCDAVGANGLLARVGCYYHDIGKLHRPAHFSENQGPGGNPHDRLPPETSADIIVGHVTEGLRLAEEARLPQVVKDFIPEHHGTREIAYFLDKARKSGEVMDDALPRFRYPGPKPRSVETAVAMIADGVEAVIRVLEDPSPERVRAAIDHVVKQRLDEGQFDEAPLTLGQLQTVKEAFVRTLGGMYHNRIEYPKEVGGITARWSAASNA